MNRSRSRGSGTCQEPRIRDVATGNERHRVRACRYYTKYMHLHTFTLTATLDAAEVPTTPILPPSMVHTPLGAAVSPPALHDEVERTGEERTGRGQNLPAGGFRTHCGRPACVPATVPATNFPETRECSRWEEDKSKTALGTNCYRLSWPSCHSSSGGGLAYLLARCCCVSRASLDAARRGQDGRSEGDSRGGRRGEGELACGPCLQLLSAGRADSPPGK